MKFFNLRLLSLLASCLLFSIQTFGQTLCQGPCEDIEIIVGTPHQLIISLKLNSIQITFKDLQ